MSGGVELETAGAGELAGRRVVVLGLGLFGGGLGAARWALARGAHVTVTDLRSADELRAPIAELEAFAHEPASGPLHLTLGRHDEHELSAADLVVVNPAVPPSAPPLRVARAAGARVTTATAILLRAARCRVIGVTGTHGKSSTVRFLGGLLRASLDGARVVVGGNIGGSLLSEIGALGPDDVAVLELSSYQLEHLPDDLGRPLAGAVLTCLGVDHLARHGTVERYHAAKHRLFDLVAEGGFVALDETVDASAARERTTGARVDRRADDGSIRIEPDSGDVRLDGERLGTARALRAAGGFQALNLALALAAARRAGAASEALADAVGALAPPPHRLEPLGVHAALSGGAPFEVWDNGVSTTPESTVSALESIGGDGARVLLAGGQAKGELDLGLVTRFASRAGWSVVGFGASGGELESGATGRTLPEAVERAVELLREGGVLAFSPACASFDAYANFSERAEAFRSALGQLAAPTTDDRRPSRD
ncbi:MAG: UDP-N-acetylmuramoyl-L-alanine--D-glutamate ligase [Planctomycetota bacterium]